MIIWKRGKNGESTFPLSNDSILLQLRRALFREGVKEIGMDIIFEEKVSGATKDREQLQKMLEGIQEGDIINVTDLTRITRSTQDLFELIDNIRSKKANLKSLKDTWPILNYGYGGCKPIRT